MLHELEALEARRIADLAASLREVRGRLLEKVRDDALGEPAPQRGAHDPALDVVPSEVLAEKPEFIALREAVVALPPEIRQAAWALMEIGRGRFSAGEWDQAIAEVAPLGDSDVAAALLEEPQLDVYLAKGLHLLGMAPQANIG
jgi:hypothetical protein